jgi:hypothetical protein
MSKRFKSSKKRFAQIPGGVGRAMELRTHQNDMSEISNQIEQLRKDNYFLDQAIKTINGIIVLAGATSVLKPGLDKLKSWLTSTNLYIKKLEQFQKVIDTNKTLSKLANPSMLKNTGVLKNEIPKLSFAMKALNVVFIVTSLNEIKKNLDEIKTLESSKGNKDDFESNKDKIDNLNSKNYFEIIRLVNSVASFIPGAFAITTAIDAVLMVFNPDNLENLGYSLDGFKGGKEEAKRVWENATKAVNSASIKDFISYIKAFDPVIASVTDPVVKKILTKTIVTLRLTPEDEFKRADPFARFDSFNKFAQQVSKYNTPQEYKQYINWVNKPGNAAIVQEAILIFKTYKNTKRKIALEQTNEILSKMRSTKNPKELEKLSNELDKINMER